MIGKKQCNTWKNKYPVVCRGQYEEKGLTNTYAFLDTLSRSLPSEALTVVAMARQVLWEVNHII